MTVLWLPAVPFCDPRKLRILDYKYGVRPATRGPSAEYRTRALVTLCRDLNLLFTYSLTRRSRLQSLFRYANLLSR